MPVTRRDIFKTITTLDFPVNKDDIIKHVQVVGADEELIEELKKLPDKNYQSRDDVVNTYEGLREKKAA